MSSIATAGRLKSWVQQSVRKYEEYLRECFRRIEHKNLYHGRLPKGDCSYDTTINQYSPTVPIVPLLRATQKTAGTSDSSLCVYPVIEGPAIGGGEGRKRKFSTHKLLQVCGCHKRTQTISNRYKEPEVHRTNTMAHPAGRCGISFVGFFVGFFCRWVTCGSASVLKISEDGLEFPPLVGASKFWCRVSLLPSMPSPEFCPQRH